MLRKLRGWRLLGPLLVIVAVVMGFTFLVTPSDGREPAKNRRPSQGQVKAPPADEDPQVLREKLERIEAAAMKNNPELAARARKLTSLVRQRMRARGQDPAVLEKDLERMKTRIEQPDLSTEAREKILDEARERIRSSDEVHQQVMSEPKIEKLHLELQADLLTAMKKEDPEVEQLIQHFIESVTRQQEQLEEGGPAQ